MKTLSLLLLLPSLALAAGPRAAGIVQALDTVRQEWATRTKTTPVSNVLCVRWRTGSTAPDASYRTTRISGALYCSIPGFNVDGEGKTTSEHCALEVQAKDGDPAQPATLPPQIEIVDREAVDVDARATPVLPQCEVAIARLAAAQGQFRCACAPTTGSTCEVQVTPPGGGAATWQPAPVGVTLSAGTWRGNCARKVCSIRAGPDNSFPPACVP